MPVAVNRRLTSLRKQQGIATLLFSIVMVLLVISAALLTTDSIFVEQKISNNDVRARHAFEAAEAGVAEARQYLSLDPDQNDDGIVDPVFDTDDDGLGDSNTAIVENGSVTVTVQDLSAGAFSSFRVSSQGFSNDRTATQTIVQSFQRLDPLPNGPRNPLITRGSMIVDGSATVVNPEGHSTIWSGSDVDLGSNNASATEIADSTQAGYPSCMYQSMSCTTVPSSNKTTIGLDVVEHDSTLTLMSPADMFQSFFGATPVNYQNAYVTMTTSGVDAAGDVHLAANEVIWVDGDLDLGTSTIGCTAAVVGANVCAAANLEPSILIVNGDFTTNSTPHVYGLIFVMGDVDLSGNVTLDGALVVAGSANSSSGSLDLTFNSDILDSTRNNGALGTPPGSWRDF